MMTMEMMMRIGVVRRGEEVADLATYTATILSYTTKLQPYYKDKDKDKEKNKDK